MAKLLTLSGMMIFKAKTTQARDIILCCLIRSVRLTWFSQ
jgi:hypothetical protein